jgi:hypothetical protein
MAQFAGLNGSKGDKSRASAVRADPVELGSPVVPNQLRSGDVK